MERWDIVHRVFAVEQYLRNGDSLVTVQRLFRRNFNVSHRGAIPDRNTILRWVEAFRTTGSVLKRKPPGLPRSVWTPENVDAVRRAVLDNPKLSVRQQALALGISRRSLHRILHNELKFHPYKMVIAQELTETDFMQRREFCERMMTILAEDANTVIIMSDEAHFHLDGYVNKQNYEYWEAKNPRELHQGPLHSTKVTAWCGVSPSGIIGPYFFEEGVTSANYVDMLNNFLHSELQRRRVNTREMWFQQDDATEHTARASMDVVRRMFLGHDISQFGDVSWPVGSPDLSICDFFLRGYLKSKVYANKPDTTEELKLLIRQEIEVLPDEMLQRAIQSFKERLRICIQGRGCHLTDIIFEPN